MVSVSSCCGSCIETTVVVKPSGPVSAVAQLRSRQRHEMAINFNLKEIVTW